MEAHTLDSGPHRYCCRHPAFTLRRVMCDVGTVLHHRTAVSHLLNAHCPERAALLALAGRLQVRVRGSEGGGLGL
jgi:hypothetical protein